MYGTTLWSVQEAGQRWGHRTREAGWGMNRHIHALGDGAGWIRLQSREVFGAQATFLCDFLHVSENLEAAAQTWRRTQPKRLRHELSKRCSKPWRNSWSQLVHRKKKLRWATDMVT
jgi:hypothetical protein